MKTLTKTMQREAYMMVSVTGRLEILLTGEVKESSYPAWRRDLRKLFMAIEMRPEDDRLRPERLNVWRYAYATLTHQEQSFVKRMALTLRLENVTDLQWNSIVSRHLFVAEQYSFLDRSIAQKADDFLTALDGPSLLRGRRFRDTACPDGSGAHIGCEGESAPKHE